MKREILKKVLLMLPLLGIMGGAYFPEPAEAAEPWPPRDNFYWLGQINKASDIINTDEKLLTKEEGRRFAAAIQKVLDDGNKKGAERPTVVITFEPFLIKAGGPDITKIHAGRSSQDMLTTVSILMQREQLLELSAALNKMTATLLNLARAHEGTLIPNYTNGVQAQPNSLGHFLLAYVNAYERDHDRIQEYYKRLNRSPMGATVLNGTGWPLNRDRMAAYLGFDGLAYNTYDAGQVFPQEAPIEMGGIASSIAIHTTSLIQEIMQQYAQPRPWILLQEGNGNTYVSSAMPQKRNPGILNRCRTDSSTLLGLAVGEAFRAHNIPAGMADGRIRGTDTIVKKTTSVVNQLDRILQALDIRPERALEELNLDWTCSQEIADVMMRKHNIPFRSGHHFASKLSPTRGRATLRLWILLTPMLRKFTGTLLQRMHRCPGSCPDCGRTAGSKGPGRYYPKSGSKGRTAAWRDADYVCGGAEGFECKHCLAEKCCGQSGQCGNETEQ